MNPSYPIAELLRTAAELRAAGNSWEAVAAKVGRSTETVRRWLVRYRALWEEMYKVAEHDHKLEADAESTALLRQQLRKETGKDMREAAKILMTSADRSRVAKAKADAHVKKEKSPTDDKFQELQTAADRAKAARKRRRRNRRGH